MRNGGASELHDTMMYRSWRGFKLILGPTTDTFSAYGAIRYPMHRIDPNSIDDGLF